MARSEFRWNKKRKHYAYLFKDIGDLRKNLLLHSDKSSYKCKTKKEKQLFKKRYSKLYKHPSPKKVVGIVFYIENRIYVDHISSFETRIYRWTWHPNDKRLI